MAALAFSGLFYSYVAWHTKAATGVCGGKSYLPLCDQPCPLVVLLLVPYGFMQWVVVNSRAHRGASGGPRAGGEDDEDFELVSYNYKAVSSIIESIITSAALLYTHWTTGLLVSWSLTLSQLFIVASGGLGLLQVDFCCSLNVRERAKYSWYMYLHGLLRTCEVVSRLSILTGFAVMATTKSPWWWLLIATELSISACLVLVYGGLRNTAVANVVCIVSATIVNVFCFVDRPSLFESAHNISWFLTLKHAVETSLALLFMICVMNLSLDLDLHSISLGTAVLTTVVYWLLFPLLCCTWQNESEPRHNIFSACRRGDNTLAEQLISQGEFRFDLNEFDVFGMTPLMHAATGGHADLCRYLLQQGASLHLKAMGEWRRCVELSRWIWKPAGRRWTAMHFAAWRGDVAVLEELLNAVEVHAKPLQFEWQDVHDNTPLHVAGQFGHAKAFKLIKRRGPEVWQNTENASGDVPINPGGDDFLPAQDPPRPRPGPVPPSPGQGAVPLLGPTRQPEVPLGAASFMVCASSAQFGRIFVPEPMISEDAVAPETYQGLHFEHLTPCRADGTRLQCVDRYNPDTWSKRDILVGKGTYGTVGRFCDEHSKLYAVKFLEKERVMDHQFALRETRVALFVRRNPHPCLVEVFFYQDLAKHICVVASFCNQGTLQDAVERRATGLQRNSSGVASSYTPDQRFEVYLAEVYLGMEHVHSSRINGIIRDLKPENVGLHAPAPAPGHAQKPRAMLLDYGSYRLTGPSPGHFSMDPIRPQGSPGYAAPEMLRNKPYDKRVDFYSFGVLAWVTLTGGLGPCANPPFSDPKIHSLKVLANDWERLRWLARPAAGLNLRELSPDQARLVWGLVEEDPDRRLAAQDVRRTLGAMLHRPLPAYGLPRDELEAWLAAAEASVSAAGA